MQKKNLGVVIGRFQPVHLGHQALIDEALKRCKRVLVLIGSAQECGTTRNPFSYEFRKSMLKKLYGDRIMVRPIDDIGIGNNKYWGAYVLGTIQIQAHAFPDVMVFGNEGICEKWFDADTEARMEQVVLSRQEKPISATMVRAALDTDNYELWKTYVDPRLHNYYAVQRSLLENIRGE